MGTDFASGYRNEKDIDPSPAPARPVPAAHEVPAPPQAWGRSLRLFGEAFLELVGLVWLLFAFSLVLVGVGVWLLPGALDFARDNAQRSRRLAHHLTGVTVRARYLPVVGEPGPGGWQHSWQRLRDPVVRRDLIWGQLNPMVGIVLGLLPVALAVDALWELAALGFQLAFPVFRPSTWFTIYTDGLGMDLAVGVAAAVTTLAVQAVLGWVLARPFLRAQGRWARLILHVEDTEELHRRISRLEASRTSALDLEQTELQRIERDLHDGAQMHFVSTGLTIGEAARLVREDPDRAIELLQSARNESAAALADLRTLVRGIRPPVLADRGFVEAVRALATDSLVPVHVESRLTHRLADPLESALYFAVSELVTNAAKHAGASAVHVTVNTAPGAVTVQVTDDGRGGAVAGRNGGLAGIRRRLDAFDATLHLLSPAGGPTVATVTAPDIPAGPA